MENDYVTLKELGEELSMDRSNLRKYILGLGIESSMVRTLESRGQLTLAVTSDQADVVRQQREEEGFLSDILILPKEWGSFYLIQVVPELDSQRIKVGFAIDLDSRLRDFRCIAPTCQVLVTWSCKRIWEKTAIDCLSELCIEGLSNEVFRCENLEALIGKGDRFFSLMPKDERE